jgi:transcriptional regulator with XRE-family HTH domain
MSQAILGKAVGLSQPQISRIERGQLRNLSVLDASRTASVLGLELVVRLYPGGVPLRDAAQVDRLRRILKHVRAPLRYRIDVPLPQRPNRPMEQRGWDAMLYGHERRTGIELEMRLWDAQATIRRHGMKRRDDPVEGFLLVLADTRTNRRVYAENADLWPDLPRLKTSRVLAALEAGDHPPSGIVFV